MSARATAPAKGGYSSVSSNGTVYAFGGAATYGDMAGKHLNAPIVGIAAVPDGKGYWLVAKDGGVFAFGSARFYNSLPGLHRPGSEPIVGMATASGAAVPGAIGAAGPAGPPGAMGATGACGTWWRRRLRTSPAGNGFSWASRACGRNRRDGT